MDLQPKCRLYVCWLKFTFPGPAISLSLSFSQWETIFLKVSCNKNTHYCWNKLHATKEKSISQITQTLKMPNQIKCVNILKRNYCFLIFPSNHGSHFSHLCLPWQLVKTVFHFYSPFVISATCVSSHSSVLSFVIR